MFSWEKKLSCFSSHPDYCLGWSKQSTQKQLAVLLMISLHPHDHKECVSTGCNRQHASHRQCGQSWDCCMGQGLFQSQEQRKMFNAYRNVPVDVKTRVLYVVTDFPAASKLFNTADQAAIRACPYCEESGTYVHDLCKCVHLSSHRYLDFMHSLRVVPGH